MAVAIANVALFVVGIVICLVGVVAGKVLSMAGDGAKTFARLSLPRRTQFGSFALSLTAA